MFIIFIAVLAYWPATAQQTERIPSSATIQLAKIGNKTILPGSLRSYGIDSTLKTVDPESATVMGGNPFAIRFEEIKADCNMNSLLLNWTAVQRSDADAFEIEQSADNGRTWKNIGRIPANQLEEGVVPYTYRYNKYLGDNVQVRIAAINNAGEKIYSNAIVSPCSNETTLSVTPNPVRSIATLRIGAGESTSVKLVLANSMGIVVQAKDEGVLKGNNNIRFDMSNLQNGFYSLSIQWANGKTEVLKLMKE